METADRVTRALRAVEEIAAAHGLDARDLRIVKDSNNTVVDLGTAPIVAKVATTTLPGRHDAFALEFAVLRHLHGSHAPVARLSDALPHGPHEADGLPVLFLDRLDLSDDTVELTDAVAALDATHGALAGIAAPLPAFTEALTAAHRLYRDDARTPGLPPDERAFCVRAGDRLLSDLKPTVGRPVVLHGDPWIGGNLVATTSGPVLLDFEAVCMGPREWDLSAFGEEAAPFGDPDLFARCLAARSFLVAALCWAQPGRAPEVDEAATWHLHLLHERMRGWPTGT